MGFSLLFDLVFGIVGLFFLLAKTRRKTSSPVPPGPKSKPLIGNYTDLVPSGEQEWAHWFKHKELYGPISSITVFGKTMIIINDKNVAFDLLEKRSAINSSRPRLTFGGKMVGWEEVLAAAPYSARFHAQRKNISSMLGSRLAVSRFYTLQEIEARRFLLRVLQQPERLIHHIRTEAGAIILKISYGYTIEPHKRDPLVDLADDAFSKFSLAMVSGAWLVDTMPFLSYLPAWLPGMGFKSTATRWRKITVETMEKPHAFVKQQMAAGIATPSFSSVLLDKADLNEEEEHVVKLSAVSLYGAGSDTTVSSLSSFFLAMTMYPDVQSKAQEELDSVIGYDRLPGFEDRENLPYVNALVKEVLRWQPAIPMGLSHASTEDAIYENYFIPKGAVLLPNVWAFMHDPETYHDPMNFKPERFLGSEGKGPEMDPHNIAFGFGRRICPGRELAIASVFLTIAQSLVVFDVQKAISEDGKVIEPVIAFTPGVVNHPIEYRTNIKPRSEKAVALILSVEEEHPFVLSDAEALMKPMV